MPGVVGLGRVSPPLSAWLGAAAPEEMKKSPGLVVEVVAVVEDGDRVCLALRHNNFRGTENSSSLLLRGIR